MEAIAAKPCFDWLITYRCPYIIPADIFGRARIEAVNIHPSLLPSYPGLNPWEEMSKVHEQQGGVTLHRLTEEADKGEIIMQESFAIELDKGIDEARDRADNVAARLCRDYLY